MREKVKQQKEMCVKKEKRKEHLLYCIEFIKISNKKLADYSIECNKLENLRGHIWNINEIKLQYELQLRTMQLNENESKRQLNDNESVDDEKMLFVESNSEGMIKWLKSQIRSLKNELEIRQEEERFLARDVELLHRSLNGVVNEVPDQMVQGLRLELEGVEKGIRACIEDTTEDLFNMLVISTEDKIRNLLKLKRIILSMCCRLNNS